MASYRHLTDEYVLSRPVRWLLVQYELVSEARWHAKVETVWATEAGVIRALTQVFAGKQLPAMPSYEELVTGRKKRPAWWDRFEEANR